jgi:bifunctional DNA-binding transcriptional regulator/antitoxin component of YhaV-PrlF toxin-antitoxin module
LPKGALKRLGIKPGDQIEFVEYDHGVLLRRVLSDIRTLKGMVPKPRKSISVETMNLMIAKMGRS